VALFRRHGSRVERVLGDARRLADLGEHFGHGLHAREIDLLQAEEWARTPEDVLFRRTKLGLHLDAAQRAAVADYMAAPAGRVGALSTSAGRL
jgi:glycerol-3-phosphate dehydrogenase